MSYSLLEEIYYGILQAIIIIITADTVGRFDRWRQKINDIRNQKIEEEYSDVAVESIIDRCRIAY